MRLYLDHFYIGNNQFYFYLKYTYYRYPIVDNDKDEILEILLDAVDTIHYHLSKGDTVLVHCYMGASRSASVIIYYLMRYYNKKLDNALNIVIKKRPVVNLTHTFYRNLKELSRV